MLRTIHALSQLSLLLAIVIVVGIVVGIVVAGDMHADDPPVKKSSGQGDLTEGLMDLLREPAKEKSPSKQPIVPPSNPSNPTRPASPQTLGGEDIGQGPSNPLAEVELGMSTLAGWLRGQPDATRTKELQRDVVLRLDEMIGQLEKQSASQSNSSSSSQSSHSQNKSASASPSDARSANANGKEPQPANRPGASDAQPQGNPAESSKDDSNSAARRQTQSPSPNQTGQSNGGNEPLPGQSQPGVSPIRSRTVNVDLNDPRALQRSAWGNLPERMREQMQSRMVERFLPPYRDEIEAYYRALSTTTK